MKKDRAKQLAEDALKELQASLQDGKSDQLLAYLNAVSKFHHYSWNNLMLIATQMPEATYVAGFHRWLELKRYVRKGEKGICIMAPLAYKQKEGEQANGENGEKVIRGFKAVYVFDISQTEGEPLPDLAEIDGDPGELIPKLEGIVRGGGIELVYDQIESGAKGVSKKGTIVIDDTLDGAERFAVLVHELAHERLHDTTRRKSTTATIRETEAEAVAYVVCRAMGLDCSTRSSDYIQLYDGNTETLSASLEAIQRTAIEIIRELEAAEAQPSLAVAVLA